MMKPKILVIGLDAATMDLIEPWVAAGELPCLAKLMNEGASSRLLSTPNMHSASAWTSILTGLSPGKHGLFVFSDRDYATGEQQFFKGGDRKGELIIDLLARNGWTSGLLNVPMTYPARSADSGFMVSGLDAPALNERAFSPEGLRIELLDRFPDYNFTPSGLGQLMSSGKVDEAIDKWRRLTKVQTAAAEYLLKNRPVDFFMTVYTASDWGGHNLWRLPGGGQGKDSAALLGIYRMLDEAVGRLLNFAGEETQVYLISDHGMGAHSGASYLLAEWLEDQGFMVRRRASASKSAMKSGRDVLKRLLPDSAKQALKSKLSVRQLDQLRSTEKEAFYSSIDWSRTTAYTEPGRHVININLAGRNRDGIVSQQEYDSVADRVISALKEWVDPHGTRVVARVARRNESYEGPFAGRASDLYIYWNAEARMGEPPAEVKARGFWWSGDHQQDGILICKGPGIARGRMSMRPAVYDLVPTIMYLGGLPVPRGLDGRVLEEWCTDEFKSRNAVRHNDETAGNNVESDSFNQSEEELVEEKLRSLGYL